MAATLRRRPAASLRGPRASPRHAALEVRKRHLRIVARRSVGKLRDNLVKPYTMKLYSAALLWFFQHLTIVGQSLPDHEGDLDDIVCEAIEEAWDSGLPRALIGNLLSGLPLQVNALYGQLKGSWKLWRVWGEKEIPCRAPPFSKVAAFAVANQFRRWGFPIESVLIGLAFFRFLRTAEFLSLKAGQFVFDQKLRHLHITFPLTKSSRRKGTFESVHVDDEALVIKLYKIVSALQPGEALLTMPMGEFRRRFAEALKILRLPSNFKPYSLRRGGATYHFQQSGSLGKTFEIGRWVNARTCKIYVNTALLELTTMSWLGAPALKAEASAFTLYMQA